MNSNYKSVPVAPQTLQSNSGGSTLSRLTSFKKGGKTQFYRQAVPRENRPAHKVKPETAGLMIGPKGEVFDC